MVNELRIGNLVQHNGNWSYLGHTTPKIIEWGQSDWYALGECRISMDDISPIPLTEEWLEKLGFEATLVWGDYANDKLLLCSDPKQEDGKIYASNEYYFSYGNKLRSQEIKYVHQLQNLYFALTGAELIEKK